MIKKVNFNKYIGFERHEENSKSPYCVISAYSQHLGLTGST